jgi:hypothetical protein
MVFPQPHNSAREPLASLELLKPPHWVLREMAEMAAII